MVRLQHIAVKDAALRQVSAFYQDEPFSSDTVSTLQDFNFKICKGFRSERQLLLGSRVTTDYLNDSVLGVDSNDGFPGFPILVSFRHSSSCVTAMSTDVV